MGLSAARAHGAIPRALAVAVVAVPKQRSPLALRDSQAMVVFVRRQTGRLDAVRMSLDLGAVLVTTVEQTVLDLAHRPSLGGVITEAIAAVRALLPRCDEALLSRLAAEQRLRAAHRLGRG
jgi:predicted transcriptional regulator of viral defense system